MTETQHIEDRLMSPHCYTGQHEDCKLSVSWIGEDGVSRTQVCPCRCHDRAPKAAVSTEPACVYLLSWEYEVVQRTADGEDELRAWIKRRVMSLSKESASDWIEAVAELIERHQVRNMTVLKAEVGKWEKVN